MGKAKKEKKSKSEKSLQPDQDLHFGVGKFEFPNGDVYEGEYCAHRAGVCWRQGHGVYKTFDGQIYEADWNDDKLVETKELNIKFPNGAEYYGTLLKNKYSGSGSYVLENKLLLSCSFTDNQPRGDVSLIDHEGTIWTGKASGDGTLLLPENIFYRALDEDRGKGELKLKASEEVEEEAIDEELEDILSDRELEKIIFADNTKTPFDLDLENCIWYQNYLKFKHSKNRIMPTVKLLGVGNLDQADLKWYEGYIAFKKELADRRQLNKLSTIDDTLLKEYFSNEFKDSCPAIKIFYPTCESEAKIEKVKEAEVAVVDKTVEVVEPQVVEEPSEKSVAKKGKKKK